MDRDPFACGRLGRFGTPPARHYDLAARSSLHGSGGNAGDGSAGPRPKIVTVERREARVSPLRDAGAPRKRPGPLRHVSAFTRVLCDAAGPPGAAAPGRLSALRPPLIGVEEIDKDPGANAPRERIVLRELAV